MKRFKVFSMWQSRTTIRHLLWRARCRWPKTIQADLTVMDVIPSMMGEYPDEMMKTRMRFLESLIEPYTKRLNIKIELESGTVFLK